MTEPKFAIGQHVAVCTASLTVVIPKTVIVGMRYVSSGTIMRGSCGKLWESQGHWAYAVDGFDTNPFNGRRGHTFGERCLRPIDPEKEYTGDEEIAKEKIA